MGGICYKGAAMDAEIEALMGEAWMKQHGSDFENGFHPSTDIAAAWAVVEKIGKPLTTIVTVTQ